MRRSDYRRALAELAADASGVEVDLDTVLDAIDQAIGVGYASSSLGGGGGVRSANSGGSVVERHAFARDKALTDRQRLAELVERAHRAMTEVQVIRHEYAAPPRLGRARRKGHADDGCEMMASIGEYEPGSLTDAGGTLGHKHRLGRWARDFAQRNGRLPVREEIERHARGGHVHT